MLGQKCLLLPSRDIKMDNVNVSFIFSLQSTEPEPLFFELVSVINQPKKNGRVNSGEEVIPCLRVSRDTAKRFQGEYFRGIYPRFYKINLFNKKNIPISNRILRRYQFSSGISLPRLLGKILSSMNLESIIPLSFQNTGSMG